ncbi:MAG: BrnA antitoxin family protein, partial [Chloroflexota bacterium]
GAVLPLPSGKERITIRLDTDVLNWFRQQADQQGGGNYQTMLNQALREYILSHQVSLEEMLRRVVREELAQYRVEES